MSTIRAEKTFRCDNDCVMSGCPSHNMQISYQNTSDYVTVAVDGEDIYSGDLSTTDTLKELLKTVGL